VATVTYTASTTAGTCTVTATEGFSGKSGTTSITQTAVKNAIDQAPAAAAVPADGTTTQVITDTVTNKGVGVSADTVTWTLTPSVAGACGTVTPTSMATNGSGVATTTYKASLVVGFCNVTGTEAGNGSSAVTTIAQKGTSTTTAITVTATPASIAANGTSTSTITATVTGAGAANDPVAFTTVGAACGTLSSMFATTNASGVASVTYTSSTTAGACGIGAVEANGGKANATVVTQTAVPNNISGSANPTSIQGNGTSTSVVTFHVTSGVDGSAVAADPMTYAVSGSNCGTLSNATASTDASGNATVTYTSSVNIGGVAHFCTVTGTETGTGKSAAVSIDQTS
jgi:adhesin/invasin